MRVLVVEDEALIRMLVCDLLEEAGFACAETADAAEALALLDAGLCKPEVLVTDYNLGPGLDGKALARGAAAPARPRHRLRLYRPRLVGHLVAAYAARAAVGSWSCLTALGGLNPCRSISHVAL